MIVKICGITRYIDAVNAYYFKADAIGFVFAKSKRQVTAEQCADIINKLPVFCYTVGVFKDNNKEEIQNILKQCPLCALQFHGEESEDFCLQFNRNVIKAVPIEMKKDIEKINKYPNINYILVDAKFPGSGKMFDHELLNHLPDDKNYIIAGGLNQDNVKHVPFNNTIYGVDVSSGVEKSPGLKDRDKMKLFIKAAKGEI